MLQDIQARQEGAGLRSARRRKNFLAWHRDITRPPPVPIACRRWPDCSVVQTQPRQAEVKQKKAPLAAGRKLPNPRISKRNKPACTVPAKEARRLSLGLSEPRQEPRTKRNREFCDRGARPHSCTRSISSEARVANLWCELEGLPAQGSREGAKTAQQPSCKQTTTLSLTVGRPHPDRPRKRNQILACELTYA
jgi:hypothetical protein